MPRSKTIGAYVDNGSAGTLAEQPLATMTTVCCFLRGAKNGQPHFFCHTDKYSTKRRRLQVQKIVQAVWKHTEELDEGGGGTLRMDFKDVQFGDLAWEDYVAIDPDRCYGINPADISIYELKRFGAYAEDGLTTRMYVDGSGFYDRWTGFIGAKYDLGATRFGTHWLN